MPCQATIGIISFSGGNLCLVVNPCDTAPVLAALNPKIIANRRTIEAEQFWEEGYFGLLLTFEAAFMHLWRAR
jgi:CO/xanthine dehydrogenase FAD-binding subunit